MSSDNEKRLERVEEKVDKIMSNELVHLKERLAAVDGKLWVVLMLLAGVVLETIFGK